jgi:hypothetical protein
MGVEAATEFAAFVNAQIGALKVVVDEEELDCEFELRRSLDVFCDVDEGAVLGKGFGEAVRDGQAWTQSRMCVDGKYTEQVSRDRFSTDFATKISADHGWRRRCQASGTPA